MQKILIVEDEEMLQRAYYRLLVGEGYEVNVAGDGFEALQVLEVFEPDLILLDILMPRMDGLEFLERAGLKENYPKIKVVAFTNFSDDSMTKKAIKLGASGSLLKSEMSPKDLLQMVKKQLKSKQ